MGVTPVIKVAEEENVLARALVGGAETRETGEGATKQHPTIQSYILGPSSVTAGTAWEGVIVMPENLVGKFSLPDIYWGDGTADNDISGTLWKYDGTDVQDNKVRISHTYSKPGVYKVFMTINGSGKEFAAGTVILNPIITAK